jgi:hypothetical protein
MVSQELRMCEGGKLGLEERLRTIERDQANEGYVIGGGGKEKTMATEEQGPVRAALIKVIEAVQGVASTHEWSDHWYTPKGLAALQPEVRELRAAVLNAMAALEPRRPEPLPTPVSVPGQCRLVGVISNALTLRGPCGPLVTIKADGNVEFGEGYTLDETAILFWEALAGCNPLLSRVRELESELARLRLAAAVAVNVSTGFA